MKLVWIYTYLRLVRNLTITHPHVQCNQPFCSRHIVEDCFYLIVELKFLVQFSSFYSKKKQQTNNLEIVISWINVNAKFRFSRQHCLNFYVIDNYFVMFSNLSSMEMLMLPTLLCITKKLERQPTNLKEDDAKPQVWTLDWKIHRMIDLFQFLSTIQEQKGSEWKTILTNVLTM